MALQKVDITIEELMTSSGGVGRPRAVSLAACSAAKWVGLLDKKTVRLPMARILAMVSPAVGSSLSPR
jgi:hypothetical protein